MRLLERPRPELRQRELIVLAVIREGRLRPCAREDLERFRCALARVVAAQAVADELVFVVDRAAADADVEAPAREIVEQRELHGEPHRMPQRELDHREADPDPPRAHGDRGGERDRIAVDRLAGEVVLREPHAVEPELIREARLLELL